MEKFLKRFWISLSMLLFILPVFLPTYPNPQNIFENIIGICSQMMFILSFPLSLFGLPLMALLKVVFGVNTYSLGGAYIQLAVFFAMGYVQWFWVVPKLWKRNSDNQNFQDLLAANSQLRAADIKDFDADGKTPLERVFKEKDSGR